MTTEEGRVDELGPPFFTLPGFRVIAGMRHDGNERTAKALAGALLQLCEAAGFGQEFGVAEHPTEDVIYVCVETEEAPAISDLTVVEAPTALIIPGRRPISGGN